MQEHKLKHTGTEFDGLLHWAEGSVPFHVGDMEASHVSMLMLTCITDLWHGSCALPRSLACTHCDLWAHVPILTVVRTDRVFLHIVLHHLRGACMISVECYIESSTDKQGTLSC